MEISVGKISETELTGFNVRAGKVDAFGGIEATRAPAAATEPQIRSYNIGLGNLTDLSGITANLPNILPSKIGVNEFIGLASPWDKPADSGEAITRGAVPCVGMTLLMHEHFLPVGVVRLIEAQDGIFAHGRIACTTQRGVLLLRAMQRIQFQLCLSSSRERKETRIIDGRQCLVTLEGRARELSICLHGGMPGAVVAALGPVSFEATPWDLAFFPAGSIHLFRASAENAGLYATIRQRELEEYTMNHQQENGGSYGDWITGMQF
jgi:hypothetical protein